MKILILGGYGTFGGRLCHLLKDEPRLTLVIAGRSAARAGAFRRSLGGTARTATAVVSRDGVDAALAEIRPDILVDATGPFQEYGPAPYGVVEACIRHRVDYLDLADAASFVHGIDDFATRAKAAGIWALAGASSFPVLTIAVVDELSRGLDSIESVRGGIAPSPYAGVGANVIRAIAGYAGQPIDVRREGREAKAFALTESADYTIAPPGKVPLRTLRFSLVEVPDLLAIARRYPGVRDVWMGAGPVPEVLHRALNGLAWLVRFRIMPSIAFLSPAIDFVSNHVRWGEHRGGMFVEVVGMRDGERVVRSWHLLAEGEDGPLIPSMAAEALIRKTLAGNPPAPGARSAAGELDLANYGRLFAGRSIHAGTRSSEGSTDASLYRKVLGDAFHALPMAVRDFHAGVSTTYVGSAEVRRRRGPLARLAAWLAGFAPAGHDIPLRVTVTCDPDGETWVRDYDGHVMSSRQEEGRGRWSRLIVERFGAIKVGLAVVVDGDRLRLVVRRWSFAGIPLPRFLAPAGDVHESDVDGAFAFHVDVASPLTGHIVTYKGTLSPAGAPAA